MRYTRNVRWLSTLPFLFLAACASTPPQREIPAPATTPAPTDQATAEPNAPGTQPAAPTTTDAANTDLWSRLRSQFEMDDCEADPEILKWAHRFTANQAGFEQRIRESLPRLAFIEASAKKHGVAGEFVLLPWVESRYRPVAGHGHRPAGMWQIVPATAHTLGLHVGPRFDGRMDVAAATDAVMSMLRKYQDRFHDWRLTDYAYNAGQYAIRKLIARHGVPPPEPSIPLLPVPRETRQHLVKLLAIACVVRTPERFHVQLPLLPAERHLVTVPIQHSMPMAAAAKRAGIPVDTLRRYNSAFRNNQIDAHLADYLLLPRGRVAQFQQAMSELSKDDVAADIAASTTHIVQPGESLWLIARRHALSVHQLEHWNRLHNATVHPGQVLQLSAPD